MICKIYAKTNNPLLPAFDPPMPKKWLTYLDMTNMYGKSMSDPLPKEYFT
jgi:hypothetical protein